MAFYHDYKTGRRVDVRKSLVREDKAAAWLGFLVVVAMVVGAGALAYRCFDIYGDQRTAQSTIDSPAATSN